MLLCLVGLPRPGEGKIVDTGSEQVELDMDIEGGGQRERDIERRKEGGREGGRQRGRETQRERN